MEQRRPAQPHVVGYGAYIVDHRKRMVEIILVAHAVDNLHPLHRRQLGENELEQPRLHKQLPPYRGLRRLHHLGKLVIYTFARYYGDTVGVALDSLEGILHYRKLQLRGEAYGSHHAQGVVGESDVGVERRANQPVAQVGTTVIAVDKLAESAGVDTQRHGIDGEIAARQVIVKSAVLHNRLAAVAVVRLLSGSYEFQLEGALFHLRGAEILIYGQMAAQLARHGPGHLYARTYRHEVDIFRFAAKHKVAHISSHHVAFAAERVGGSAHRVKHRFVNFFLHCSQ